MRLVLHGGFGEKGRTCMAVEAGGLRLLIDAGVKTSAVGRDDYYPAIDAHALGASDAIVVTHGHEDHVAALGWCLEHGFRGRIFMTRQTAREADEVLAGYGTAAQLDLLRAARVEPLPSRGDALRIGGLAVATGRSGHIAGGVWCVVSDPNVRFAFCGDIVPGSPVFAMDPLPACDAIALDASYGDDDVPAQERARQIADWVAARPGGCVLPTPRFGRSAELLAIVPGPIALAPGMREALQSQLADDAWLGAGVARTLAPRLQRAVEWRSGDALPRAALLCHDAMGLAGPSRDIMARARAQRHPTLFTGHLPTGSPADRMVAEGLADWIRLPTHPTRPENCAVAAQAGASLVLGHSCEPAPLARLAAHLPSLRVDARTGDTLTL
jgi:glyoxylase-like metal-dependent hydrolase (beta-lactamase superfamily II)